MSSISVVIPAFNAEAYLSAAVDSVLAQSLAPSEVIVIDDGSVDGTAKVAESYGDKIRFLQQANCGVSASRNRGILSSDSSYIAFLDADDLWHESKLEIQHAALERRREAPFAYDEIAIFHDQPAFTQLDSEAVCADPVHLFPQLLEANRVACSSILVRRSALARSGLFDTHQIGAEDRDLWLRLARLGDPIKTSPALTAMREHPNRTTKTLRYRRNRLLAQEMMFLRWTALEIDTAGLRKDLMTYAVMLAYEEYDLGNFRAAAELFNKSARYGDKALFFRAKALQAKAMERLRGKS